MPQEQLLTYIKTQLASGYTKESIIKTLTSSGYAEQDITSAFANLGSSPLSHNPPQPLPQVIATPASSPHILSSQTVYTDPTPATPSQLDSHHVSRFGKKHLLFILIPFILLIVIGLSSFWYITNLPSYVLNQAYEKSRTINTLAYDATVKTSFSLNLPDFSALTASPTGQLQFSDDYTQGALAPMEEKKSNFILTLHIKGSSDLTAKQKHSYFGDISIGDGDLNSFGAGFEMRTLGDMYYLRITKFPNFGLFDTASITNHWIKVDAKDSMSTSPTYKNNLSDADSKKLQEMAKKAEIASVGKTLSDEVIEGQNSHHYQLLINMKNFETFLSDASVILTKNDTDQLTYSDLKKFVSEIDIKKSEIWVSKKDKYITRILMEMTGNKTEYGDLSLTTDIKMKDFNKPVSIIAPLDAKNVEELLQSSFGTYSSFGSPSASFSPTASPTPIILPYGTVLGDKTKEKNPPSTNTEDVLRQTTAAEQLASFILQQFISK